MWTHHRSLGQSGDAQEPGYTKTCLELDGHRSIWEQLPAYIYKPVAKFVSTICNVKYAADAERVNYNGQVFYIMRMSND